MSRTYLKILLLIILCKQHIIAQHDTSIINSAQNLIKRVTPGYSQQFKLEFIEKHNGKDVFEIVDRNGGIVLRGNNQIALASAFNWYLKYICKVHISWCGTQMALPQKLPLPVEKIRIVIEPKYRVHFNYCTLNYTASWWDWKRWEREIDYMAMNGINMPLSVVGLEGVWYNTLLKFGYSDMEARRFLVGPAFFAWQWMTNIQSHAGPLPKSWIDSHIILGKKIINREIELGMSPIQQGFSGYVPREFIQKFPDANIAQKKNWVGFEGTAQLDPLDPLFKDFGKVFLEEQEKLFGAHGVYAADPFHEGHPPDDSPKYLSDVGKGIYGVMNDFDPNALWVMQGWTLRKNIVNSIPKQNLLILDLKGVKWKENEGYWGYDFVVGQVHNFGGRINLHGDLNLLAGNPYKILKEDLPNVSGIGLFMEGMLQNPVYYNLALEMAFHESHVDIKAWLKDYATRRYGAASEKAAKAWHLLLEGPYRKNTNGTEFSSIICARPALVAKKSGPNKGFKIPYDPKIIIQALDLLLNDSAKLSQSDAYRYDIVDLQRQMLTNLGQEIHKAAVEAFKNKNLESFKLHSGRFLELLKDADQVLKTRAEFSFDKWVADARRWGAADSEKDLYEYNASLLVTQWGEDLLFDYSWREWSGLIEGYYYQRWKKFYDMLLTHLENGTDYSEDGVPLSHKREKLRANEFYANLDDWEKEWIGSCKVISPLAIGDELEIVNKLYSKYKELETRY